MLFCYRLSYIAVFFAFWVIMLSICMGKTGLINYVKLRNLKHTLHDTNHELSIEKHLLKHKIEKLNASRQEKEAFLLAQYGYLKKNHYVYRFEKVPETFDFRKKVSYHHDAYKAKETLKQ
jgi:cell division protein FtsB